MAVMLAKLPTRPFAGMTQIRFKGFGLRHLSPHAARPDLPCTTGGPVIVPAFSQGLYGRLRQLAAADLLAKLPTRPFAGMTQIRFKGFGLRHLSPHGTPLGIACSHPCTPGSPLHNWRSCDCSRV
jgi:hypothetical protein